MDLNKITINKNACLLEVLKKIDALPSMQTVFVVNENNVVLGSITDGDIRRGLIQGLTLDAPIDKFTYKEFSFLKEDYPNFEKLKEFRKRKLKVVPLLSTKGKLKKIYDFTFTKSILPVDAVIMAGGLGSRLKPLTNDKPKPLLKIGAKEIIAYNFDRLHQYGITNQFITVNYLAEQIKHFCTTYNDEINFQLIAEKEFFGTAGALSLIDRKSFENDTILLMNSDLLTNIDYEDFYKSFVDEDADILVASIPYQVNLPYAIFDEKDRKVQAFREKPKYTYYANAGLYLIKKELLELVPKNTIFNATDLMDAVIAKGLNLRHYPIRQYWLDIGNHEDFEKAQKDIAHINW